MTTVPGGHGGKHGGQYLIAANIEIRALRHTLPAPLSESPKQRTLEEHPRLAPNQCEAYQEVHSQAVEVHTQAVTLQEGGVDVSLCGFCGLNDWRACFSERCNFLTKYRQFVEGLLYYFQLPNLVTISDGDLGSALDPSTRSWTFGYSVIESSTLLDKGLPSSSLLKR